jgi:hypothetical protein
MTAAGLAFDVQALTYSGIIFVALALVLWGWWYGTGQRSEPVPATASAPGVEEPVPSDPNERALVALRRARDNGKIAHSRWSKDGALQAIHEIQAALLSAHKQFGTGIPTFEGDATYHMVLKGYLYYVDLIYPLLREGHIEEAKRRASEFHISWGY